MTTLILSPDDAERYAVRVGGCVFYVAPVSSERIGMWCAFDDGSHKLVRARRDLADLIDELNARASDPAAKIVPHPLAPDEDGDIAPTCRGGSHKAEGRRPPSSHPLAPEEE